MSKAWSATSSLTGLSDGQMLLSLSSQSQTVRAMNLLTTFTSTCASSTLTTEFLLLLWPTKRTCCTSSRWNHNTDYSWPTCWAAHFMKSASARTILTSTTPFRSSVKRSASTRLPARQRRGKTLSSHGQSLQTCRTWKDALNKSCLPKWGLLHLSEECLWQLLFLFFQRIKESSEGANMD